MATRIYRASYRLHRLPRRTLLCSLVQLPFPLVYIDLYGFNLGKVGLTSLSITVDLIIALVACYSQLYLVVGPDNKRNGLVPLRVASSQPWSRPSSSPQPPLTLTTSPGGRLMVLHEAYANRRSA